ncbi:TPA: WecB/TagA/CpsF family glycosyltransferase [Pseudomonas putida]|uniref:WecB/TagA/CpsF family glycosyltransferase n=1 Tax=Pseudomonas TaxID=286 RepID=UPI000481A110|nr:MULTISPECIES: WecB/TagA/CpsF family glycosyltransferase [Pseudomonas]MDD2149160.1 WecB/TagA/CpsF family glycosyltransferase [Pseudomonas putida]RAS22455.1 exopolysaccharide biosynthesis WecB/TagA/CpsF family protein [Pseudomonas sp. URMO17WK12:I7]SMF01502.1 polymer biosynthesis protein, WecB/TagA/CpsF family [Pseudomonas sp. URMO17WK12:I5]HDS1681432.1 WecB/TagA/CpsF family glycosyltransferase [Pseudomonas putida]
MGAWAWLQRWKTIMGKLHLVEDAAGEQQLLASLCSAQQPTVLGFVNAHAMNLVAGKADYCQALASADVLLRDGAGMAILLRRLGLAPGLNMNGTDFIPKLLAAFNGRRVAFWGTREPFLSEAAQRCEARYGVHVVSRHDGFAQVDTYLGLAQQQQPALIVLGMGMPKQEQVAARLATLGYPCLIVCGGAIVDFLGGKVTRAPHWVRRLNGEWIFRLLKEPKRLFTRYVLGNPLFLLRALLYARAPAHRL